MFNWSCWNNSICLLISRNNGEPKHVFNPASGPATTIPHLHLVWSLQTAAADTETRLQTPKHDPGVCRINMWNHSLSAEHTTHSRLLFTKTPSRDEDILEQKPFLPESMTDTSGGFHGPLTQKRDDKNHSCVTAEDEILHGRKYQPIKPSEIRDRRRKAPVSWWLRVPTLVSAAARRPRLCHGTAHLRRSPGEERFPVSTASTARPLPDVTVRGSERPIKCASGAN